MENSCSRSSSRARQRSKRYSSGCRRLVGQRDDVVGADEDVDLGRVQAPDALVEAREVQDDEQVVVVLVDLRALVAGEDVLVVERVEVEVLLEPRAVGGARALDVDPAQAVGLDDLDVGSVRLRRTGDDGPADARSPRRGFGRLGMRTSRLVGQGQDRRPSSRFDSAGQSYLSIVGAEIV